MFLCCVKNTTNWSFNKEFHTVKGYYMLTFRIVSKWCWICFLLMWWCWTEPLICCFNCLVLICGTTGFNLILFRVGVALCFFIYSIFMIMWHICFVFHFFSLLWLSHFISLICASMLKCVLLQFLQRPPDAAVIFLQESLALGRFTELLHLILRKDFHSKSLMETWWAWQRIWSFSALVWLQC